MQSQNKNAAKKDYRSPKLVTYGNISEVTRNITDMGAVMDNPTMKT